MKDEMKNIKNKKAFTLVELLAVIVVLGLIIAIITPTVNKSLKTSEEALEQEQIDKLIYATKKYVIDNTDLLPSEEGEYQYIRLSKLIEDGVIDNEIIINPKTREEMRGCIIINYNSNYNQYEYQYEEGCVKENTVYAFNYKKDYQIFKSPTDGYYKLEVWGAQGGYRTEKAKGGKGGYAKGTIYLNEDDLLYVYVGGSGITGICENNYCAGGYNGGGIRKKYKGGGGATDIRLIANENPLNKESLMSRIIVAGGGGSDGSSSNAGRFGGGTSGGAANSGYGSYGYGGTQLGFTTELTPLENQGKDNINVDFAGGFGFGGFGGSKDGGYGGAGGGGWYGGTGAIPDGSGDDDKGGGGGSGFVYTEASSLYVPQGYSVPSKYYLIDTNLISGDKGMPNYEGTQTITGNENNGYAKITYLGKEL